MTTKTTETRDDGIPAALLRTTNAKGVTLSAGIAATGSKLPAPVGPAVEATPAEVKAIKAKKPKFTGKRKVAAPVEPKQAAARAKGRACYCDAAAAAGPAH